MITRPAEVRFIVPCLADDTELLNIFNNFAERFKGLENTPERITCKPVSDISAELSLYLGPTIIRGRMVKSTKEPEMAINLLVPMDYVRIYFDKSNPVECMRTWFIHAYNSEQVKEATK
jgi:hypothetical protein